MARGGPHGGRGCARPLRGRDDRRPARSAVRRSDEDLVGALTGITVVVPVRNGADTLTDTLMAIAAQAAGPRPVEIIVVDDGSRDRSRDLVDAFARHTPVRVLEGPHRGAAAAVNCGIRAASHALIAQIDQDVAIEPGWLDRVADLFADPRV